ncbi:MAG: hypothetical protein COW30_12230 [Rhodospirillales bacterium CG15_BIG_FIL_POST_REV_8_21_14_020_66_15]|nr:MAG: hypothetical protein COW30_12230 [Rhodospirillales bacterium CG15_BIG_FIL_POST_REV_8_21_14_020_66_15]
MAYVKHLFLGIFSLVVLGGGTNLLVDPFDIFGTPRIDRINTHKSIGVERLSKPLQAVARKPATVILGTSRCLHGIDPKDVPGGHAYNLSIPGALADELTALARHVAQATTAKRLVLCLNLVSFSDTRGLRDGFYDDVLGPWGLLRSLPRTVFSYAALKRSRNTLRDSLRGRSDSYRTDGFRPFRPRDGQNGTMTTPLDSFLSPGGAYRNFSGFQAKLADFPSLFRYLRAAGLEVIVVVPPIHALQLEAIAAAGLWPLFEDWKRGLAAICAQIKTPCWDFAGYSPVSTEALRKPPENFGDTSHFLPHVGRMMLNRVLGAAGEPAFGTELSPSSIEQRIAVVRTARDAYRRDHPDDVEIVRASAAQYGLK